MNTAGLRESSVVGHCGGLMYLIHPDVHGRRPLDVACKYITVTFLETVI